MISPPEITEKFRRICAEKKIAATHQRQAVYQAVLSSSDHPTPESLYERVRLQIPSMSLATVYKCLHTFLELGLIKEASLHHGSVRIEVNLAPHSHVVCRVCGFMADVDEREIAAPSRPSALPSRFKIEATTVEFIGACGNCAAKMPPSKRG